ncbi:MAG: carboxypeptidase-like regulatory domain-containing protein [Acidobacteriota bacterium]
MKKSLLLAACVSVALHAQTPTPRDSTSRAPAATPVPAGTASLSGVVLDETSHPLRRATVLIHGDRQLEVSTVTDDHGRWTFTALPAGRFTITASKPAYPSMSFGARRPNRPGSGVLLSAGKTVSDVTLTLPRGAVLSGVVFDDHGQPMPDVPVMAWELRTSLGGERTLDFPASGGESVVTDDRGRYRIYGLPAGEYTVGTAWFYSGMAGAVRVPSDEQIRAAFAAAQRPPGSVGASAVSLPQMPTSEHNFTATFLPGTTDPDTATTVQVAAGDERNDLNIQMLFRPMSVVTGTVEMAQGSPSIELRLHKRTRVSALNVTTFWSTSDGKFTTASLAPGNYTLTAHLAANKTTPAMWAQADLAVTGAEPVTVALTMSPSMTVTGRLVFNGSASPPADLSSIRVELVPMPDSGSRTSDVVVDASGTFSVGGVIPGGYRVIASAQPGPSPSAWTMRSVVSDGEDVTDLPLVIGPSGNRSMVVTFSDQVGELSGTVSNPSGGAVTDYFVIVVPADSRYWIPGSRRIVSARPDVTGQFRFRGLPPGAYRIAATTDLVQRDLQDLGALAQIAEHASPLTLDAGEKKVYDFAVGR